MSRRTHLHDLTRHLRRYLSWQRARGTPGVVPATEEERAEFDARKKAAEDRKLEARRAAILGEDLPKKEASKRAPTRVPERDPATAPHHQQQQPANVPKTDVASPKASERLAAKEKSNNQSARSITTATPLWKKHDAIYQMNEKQEQNAKKYRKKAAPSKAAPEKAAQPDKPHSSPVPDEYDSMEMMDEDYQADPRDPRDMELFDEKPAAKPKKKAVETPKTPAQKMEFLKDYLGACQRCPLSEGRTNVVFGEGNPSARLMFIGEGPDYHEDREGSPFVGKAGELLTKMIEAMGLSREEVYLTHIVKCHPPEDRAPRPKELAQCAPFLKKQIQVVEPDVIVSLGRFSTNTLLGSNKELDALRGRFHDHLGVAVLPSYHPAALLEDKKMKRAAWADLKRVMKRLGHK